MIAFSKIALIIPLFTSFAMSDCGGDGGEIDIEDAFDCNPATNACCTAEGNCNSGADCVGYGTIGTCAGGDTEGVPLNMCICGPGGGIGGDIPETKYYSKAHQENPNLGDDFLAQRAVHRGACDMGWSNGCNRLGYAWTQLPKPNFKKAVRAVWESCDLGNARGCYAVGLAFTHGFGVKQDVDRGALILAGACAQGEELACDPSSAEDFYESLK